MHKEAKNDKVLRAITIGIAAMMATASMPTTVLANENPEGQNPTPEEAPEDRFVEDKTEAETQDDSVKEEITEIRDSADDLADDSAAATDLIDAALVEANVIGDQVIIDDLIGARNALEGIDGEIGATDELSAAAELLDDAASIEANANILIGAADETVDALIGKTDDYKKADKKTTKSADDTIESADIANNSGDKKEAYKARDKAAENLELVEAGFIEANKAYDDAWKKADDAETEYEIAEKEHQAALDKVEEAKARLMEAQMNSIAASEMLKAAQERASSLERRAEKLQETKQQLEAIRTQYYAMMVQYYRDYFDKNDKTAYKDVYTSEGTLNIDASAAKMTQESIDKKASSPGDRVMKLGRDLMMKLVQYQVMTDENVDWENAEFEFGKIDSDTPKGEIQEAREGKVFESDQKHVAGAEHGEDQVVVDQVSRKNIDGGTIYSNPAFNFRQIKSTDQTDKGRTNRVLVTYKDKDGNEHSAYYNYVFKSSAFGDDTDLTKGMISLVEVVQAKDENGDPVVDKKGNPVWETKKVLNENNFDDYKNLLSAIDTAEAAQDYEKAAQAVKEAEEKVLLLAEEIEELQKTGVDSSKLTDLKDKLDKAKEELGEATKQKLDLQKKVEEARTAYAEIDLSRFDIKNVPGGDEATDEDEGGTTPAGETGGATIFSSIPGSIPGASGPATGSFASASGVVTDAAGSAAETDGAGTGASDVAVTQETDSLVKKLAAVPEAEDAKEADVETLEENLLPGAQTIPEAEKENMNFWWLAVIALFGAAGWKMYENHKAKKEAKENTQA